MSKLTETSSRSELCLLENVPVEITDLIASLTAVAERLGGKLHPSSIANLAGLVRVMNCYYSNLIERHNTTPRDIERALANDLGGRNPSSLRSALTTRRKPAQQGETILPSGGFYD